MFTVIKTPVEGRKPEKRGLGEALSSTTPSDRISGHAQTEENTPHQ